VVAAEVSAILTRNSEGLVRKNVISYVSTLCDSSPACGQGKAVYTELKYRHLHNPNQRFLITAPRGLELKNYYIKLNIQIKIL